MLVDLVSEAQRNSLHAHKELITVRNQVEVSNWMPLHDILVCCDCSDSTLLAKCKSVLKLAEFLAWLRLKMKCEHFKFI